MQARALTVRQIALVSTVAIVSAISAISSPAAAQGAKGAAAKKPAAVQQPAAAAAQPPAAKKAAPPAKQPAARKTPPGQARKQVSPNEAVVLSRQLLVKHGFQVIRVETVSGAQVIYYRAGNNGRGRGLGPVQKMIVRPAGTIVSFEAVPESVRLDIRLQFGF